MEKQKKTRNRKDRGEDGLRPLEREVINLLLSNGKMQIKDITKHFYGDDAPAEGNDSARCIRNAIRKPIMMGIIKRAGFGVIAVSKAYFRRKDKMGKKEDDRYMEKATLALKRGKDDVSDWDDVNVSE